MHGTKSLKDVILVIHFNLNFKFRNNSLIINLETANFFTLVSIENVKIYALGLSFLETS